MKNGRTSKMTEATLAERQSQAIADLLPRLMRTLFTFDRDPVAEMPFAQLRVCTILLGGSRSISAISRELGISVSAVTQLADRLERTRLVKRVAGQSDRRVRQLQLTDRGERVLRQREETRVQRVGAALAHLSATTRQEVLAALEQLTKAAIAAKLADAATRKA